MSGSETVSLLQPSVPSTAAECDTVSATPRAGTASALLYSVDCRPMTAAHQRAVMRVSL